MRTLILATLMATVLLSGCMEPELEVRFRNRTQEAHHMVGSVESDGKVLWSHEVTVEPTSAVSAPPLRVQTGTYTAVFVLDGVEYREDVEIHRDRKSLEFVVGPNGPSITGAVL